MRSILGGVLICLSQVLLAQTSEDNTRPNILVFMADDLGIGDVGCFGNSSISTPNIDRLCQQGLKLTHHMSAAALCTPSRASFLTGRYPPRTGLAGDANSPPVIVYTSARSGLPSNETTWAKVLQNSGYQTAAFGKWHLGWDEDWRGDQNHGPLGHGFQYFFGLPFTLVDGMELNTPFLTYSGWRQSGNPLHDRMMAAFLAFVVVLAVYNKEFGYTMMVLIIVFFMIGWFFLEHFRFHTDSWWGRSFYMEKLLNSVLMEDRKVYEQPINLPKLVDQLSNKTLAYLDKVQNSSDPFAIYFAFPNVHTPLVPNKRFRGKSKFGPYGDSILEMDTAIGKILDKLDEMHVADNTLVYFTSDHGCHIDIGTKGGSNGIFPGGKMMGAMEGGIRVPGVLRWPKVIPKGSSSNVLTTLTDFLPTVLDIIRTADDSNQSKDLLEKLDGKSYSQLLSDPKFLPKNTRMFRHYCGIFLHGLTYETQDGRAFKAYFHLPKLNSQGLCEGICPCFGPDVLNFTQPIIYDKNTDPKEQNPLTEDNVIYQTLLPLVMEEKDKANSEWNPPSQLASMWTVMPRPWFQPCARFPLCRT